MQVEFAAAFLKRLKAEGLHTAVDTCGAIGWDAFEKVIPYTDLFLYDFKHIDTQRHRALTGMGNERPLDNLRLLSEAGAAIEVRMPLIPGINDSREELVQAGRLLSGYAIRKMKILPYHAMARSKYEALGMEDTLPHVESPDDARLDEVAGILQGEGVHAISGRR